MWRCAMKKNLTRTDVFYYSRRKLALYLLFNLGLLTLALFFTWVIFPQYGLVYSFAVGTCLLSVAAASAVIIIHHPLAVITPASIKIDLCAPLKWKDIKKARKIQVGHQCCRREIIVLEVKDLSKHRLNFMQKLIKNSEFSAFSIPLYAMEPRDAEAIESIVGNYVSIKKQA